MLTNDHLSAWLVLINALCISPSQFLELFSMKLAYSLLLFLLFLQQNKFTRSFYYVALFSTTK